MRVVPSQIVHYIDKMFPAAEKQREGETFAVYSSHAGNVAGLVGLVDRLPDELIVPDRDVRTLLMVGLEAARYAVDAWSRRGTDYQMRDTPGYQSLNPITLIRQALVQCSDEVPAAEAQALQFIQASGFRASLCSHHSAMNSALANGEWREASDLAVSLIKALLQWRFEGMDREEVWQATGRAVDSGLISRSPIKDLTKWNLEACAGTAHELKMIDPLTLEQVALVREMRDLIRPSPESPDEQAGDRGSALSAVASAEHVIRDLERYLGQD